MRRLSTFVLHAIAAGTMAWGLLILIQQDKFSSSQKGGHFQFLTNQGVLLAWLYMTVSLLCDVLPSVIVLRGLKVTLLMISMPIASTISIIYWSFFLFFPELTAIPLVDPSLMLPVDLALHVMPVVTLMIDFFVFESKFSKSRARKAAPAALVVFGVWYGSFVEYCAMFNGFFPYPSLTYSPLPVRVLIYTGVTVLAVGSLTTLNALHAR